MINRFVLVVASCIFLISYKVTANNLQGVSGDVIAVKTNITSSKSLTFKYNASEYQLVGLPYVFKTENRNINNLNIEVQYKNFGESRITITDLSKVDLSKADRERANSEALLIQKAVNSYDISITPSFNFINPVQGVISSRYGKQRFINDKPRSPHLALDIAANTGTEISAPLKGKIILTGDFFYTGNTIIIDHGFGLISSYSHLDSISVNESQIVQQGDLIGAVGETGRVTGPHLHWTVYLNKERINPEKLLKEDYLKNIFKVAKDTF
tara:strand:- start:228 stop:1034 length:807 start_codon:yes stop_codon:yes gene_type:complete